MSIDSPFVLPDFLVGDEYLDHNGHMGIRSYTRIFDAATTPFYVWLGLSRKAVAAHDATIYALQDTSWYRNEVMHGDTVRITAQLIDHDHNKLVTFFTMMRENDIAACFELIEILIDRITRKPRAFPEEIMQRLQVVKEAHDQLGRPSLSGRGIGIVRRDSRS